jgi:VCBS repeat-containing protein
MDFEFGRGAAERDEAEANLTQAPSASQLAAQAAGASLAALAAAATRITPVDGVVTLPAGTPVDAIRKVGADLLVTLPDGSQILIVDGAISVPQIVIGAVQVPPANLAALLIGQEPQPAAGPPQSSGGNFFQTPGDIGDPFDLGDLLPPTQLAFPEPEERELLPDLVDEEPTTVIVTPDQPAGSSNATSTVNEAGLPARGTEPPGSNEPSNSETVTGSIVFDTPDGFGSITINGTAITAVGQTITTPLGRLTITSIAPGNIGYSYTLADNTLTANPTDVFTVVVTDDDGDSASANLTISILDDVPTARNDTDAVAAGSYAPQGGNVVTGAGTTSGAAGADTPGADGASVTGVRAGTTGNFAATGSTINGQYGTLTLNADGSYTYTRAAGTPGGVTDTFSYQLTDGDGDTSTATLVISIGDLPPAVTQVPTTGDGTVVNEAGLPPRGSEPPGSNSEAPSETTSGTITFTPGDAPATVSINGTVVTGPGQVITTPTGTLTITSYDPNGTIGYSFTLTDNTSGDTTSQTFTVTVTDADGDSDTEPFTITIIDDAPTARADVDSVTEDDFDGESESAPRADGNVITASGGSDANATDGVADTPGADGASVTAVRFGETAGTVGGATNGQYGTLTLNANGSYVYVLNNDSPAVQGLDSDDTLTEVFTYTITDGDGDPSTTTLTITINGSDDPITIGGLDGEGPDLVVDEDDLSDGSSPNAPALTKTGTFTVNGVDGIASITIEGTEAFVGQTFTTAHGTFTITSISAPADGNATSISVGYSYVLTDNLAHPSGNGENSIVESFDVAVTDTDGSTDTAAVDVQIIDDVPDARDDADSVTEDDFDEESEGPPSADGNVLTGVGGSDANTTDGVSDVPGADGIRVTTIRFGEGTETVGGEDSSATISGLYGTLTIFADGSYRYVLDNRNPAVQGLDGNDTLTEVFTYGIIDNDGDSDSADLIITINGSDDPITINGLNVEAPELTLDEDDLADGSDPAPKDPLTQTGSFTVNGTDGIASIRIEATEAFVGQTVTTAFGTFTITSISAPADGNATSIVIGYSYTLTDNTAHPNANGQNFITEVFDIDVTDTDGSTDSDTIEVRIIDDVPTANDDSVTQTVENAPVTFGVFGNDVFGADGVDTDNAPNVAVTFTQPPQGGTVTYNPATGQFTFTQAAGQTGVATFTYTIVDGDGDPSTATVTITLTEDSTPTVSVTDTTVDEKGLPAGSGELADGNGGNNSDTSETNTGSFTISTGGDTLGKVEVQDKDGNWIDVTAGGTVNGATGVLTVTVSAGVYSYSYTLTTNLTTHPDTINGADGDGDRGAADPVAGDSFAVRVTDNEGDVSPTDTINVTVLDDGPSIDVTKGADADVVLTTQDAETDGNPTDTDTATSDANFGGVFGLTSLAGADGAAAPSLSFALGVASSVSGLTSNGVAINLYLIGGKVVGSTAASAGAVNAGNTVFDLAVSGTGVVTLSQYQQVDHDLPGEANGPYDDQFETLLDGKITLTASSTITDGDGDTATDSETIDLGGNIRFADDGPSVTNPVVSGSVTLDETTAGSPAGFGAGGISATSATAIISATTASGADTPASTSYAISLAGDGTTTLKTAIGDFAITLVQTNATTITGTYNDGSVKTAFVAVINANGTLTVTQFVPLEHLDDGGPGAAHDDALNLAGLVNATITIKDFDGDTASATTSIGGAITFKDDGPSIGRSTAELPALVVDETDLLVNSPATSFAGAFTVNYGADGAGTTTYALSVNTGIASGLVDVATGAAVVLSVSPDGTVVTGRAGPGAGDPVVFTLTLNPATGELVLDQQRAVAHDVDGPAGPAHDDPASLANGAISLTATVTDSDGDTDAETIAIGGRLTFEDDGPDAAVANPVAAAIILDETTPAGTDTDGGAPAGRSTLTVGFAANFAAPVYGADGAGTTAYGLVLTGANVASGLFALGAGGAQGAEIVLNQSGNTITGSAGGQNYFTITVDTTTGEVTFTQLRNVWHANTGNDDDTSTLTLANSNLLTLVQTVTDRDGDFDTAALNLGQGVFQIQDDGPDAVVTNATGDVFVLDESPAGTDAGGDNAPAGRSTITASLADNFGATIDYGSDGAGSVAYALALSANGIGSGLFALGAGGAQGAEITLSRSGNTITGSAGGQDYFTIAIDPATGVVTFTQIRNVWHANTGSDDDSSTLTLDGAGEFLRVVQTVTDADGDTDTAFVDLGTGSFTIEDDGPTAAISVAGLLVRHDETLGNDGDADDVAGPLAAFAGITNVGDDPDVAGTGPIGFARDLSGISSAGSSTGTDGGTIRFGIGVSAAGVDSGLDTTSGQSIFLFKEGDLVVGRVGGSSGAAAFAIAVDATTGAVSVVQYLSLAHSTGGAASPDEAISIASTALVATVTVTDGDNDVETASANIGGLIQFQDDGPSIDIAASGTALIVDESLGTTGSTQNEGGRQNNDETLTGAAPGAIGFATGLVHSLVSANAGVDGEASRVYALSVTNSASGLTDSVTNENIVLSLTGAGVIEGRTTSGLLSFTIAVNPSTGAVTINQFRAVEHNDSADHDENGDSAAMMSTGRIALNVTLTDGDGDTATDTADISQLFKFEDDGPAATADMGMTTEVLTNFNTAFVLDFSGSIDNGELNTQLTAVKAAITALFASTGGSVSVKFVLFASTAIASATFTSAAAANAYIDSVNPSTGGTRPGSIGSSTDFTDAIQTLLANYAADETANNQVFFLSDGNPNQQTGTGGNSLSDATAAAWNSFVDSNNINVTAIGVGGGIDAARLQDVDLNAPPNNVPILVADFDDLIATLTALIAPTPITGDLDANDDFGTDGGRILSVTVPVAGPDVTYTWNGVSGASSQITVSGGGTTITGTTSITVPTEAGGSFTLNFATGQWSYTPPRSVAADTTEVFNYTVVDGDGDTASSNLSVLVKNNPPPTTAPVTATVDDDALAGGNPGGSGDLDANVGETPASASEAVYNGLLGITAVDNPIAAISFAQLQGTTVSVGTETATLSWNALTDTLTATGPRGVLFTVQITNTATGAYTVTLVDNVLHSTVAGENDATVALTYRVSDTDGSSATGVLNITFDDDTPLPFYPDTAVAQNGNSPAVTAALLFDAVAGADDVGGATFNIVNGTLARDADGNLLKIGGQQLYLFGNGTGTLTATTSSTGSGGTVGYTITLNPGADTFTLDVNNTISNGSEISISNLTSAASGNVAIRGIGAGDATNAVDVLLSGRGGTVNTSTTGIGVGNQSVDPTEAVRIDLVSNLVADGSADGFAYTDHVSVSSFRQTISQVQGAASNTVAVRVWAIDADNDETYGNTPGSGAEGGETIRTINSVVVTDSSTGLSYTFTANGTQAGFSVTFNANGSVNITGLQTNDQYKIGSATAFDAVVVESPTAGQPAFDLGIFSIETITSGNPINLAYNVNATDGDGDAVAGVVKAAILPTGADTFLGDSTSQTISGNANANAIAGYAGNDTLNGLDGNDTLYGGLGNDTLNGGNGLDTLHGGLGLNTLTGGAGNDSFVIDRGAIAETAQVDIITDYAAGDLVDLTQLISVPTGTNVVTGGFVRYLTGSGDIQVDLDGGGNNYVTVATLDTSIPASIVVKVLINGVVTNVTVNASAPPVALDLDGDGVEFVSSGAGVAFDYNGDGSPENTAWVGRDDGLLAIDRNGNGRVDDGSEIVFARDGLTDLEGLAADHDSNGDGVLDANDADFAKFGVWQDANGNGVSDAGEFQSLSDAGIASIGLVSDGNAYTAAGGDVAVSGEATYTRTDGTTGKLADVAFNTRTAANDDQRAPSGSAGLSGAMVAAGLIAAVAADGSKAPQVVDRVADGQDADAAARDVRADLDTAASKTAQVERIEAPDGGIADNAESVRAMGAANDDHGFKARIAEGGDTDAKALIADLLAPTELDHAALARPAISMDAVDQASAALIAAQQGGDKTAAIVEVVADALAGGQGPSVDALLDALAGPAAPALGALQADGLSDAGGLAVLSPSVLADLADHATMAQLETAAAHGHA